MNWTDAPGRIALAALAVLVSLLLAGAALIGWVAGDRYCTHLTPDYDNCVLAP